MDNNADKAPERKEDTPMRSDDRSSPQTPPQAVAPEGSASSGVDEDASSPCHRPVSPKRVKFRQSGRRSLPEGSQLAHDLANLSSSLSSWPNMSSMIPPGLNWNASTRRRNQAMLEALTRLEGSSFQSANEPSPPILDAASGSSSNSGLAYISEYGHWTHHFPYVLPSTRLLRTCFQEQVVTAIELAEYMYPSRRKCFCDLLTHVLAGFVPRDSLALCATNRLQLRSMLEQFLTTEAAEIFQAAFEDLYKYFGSQRMEEYLSKRSLQSWISQFAEKLVEPKINPLSDFTPNRNELSDLQVAMALPRFSLDELRLNMGQDGLSTENLTQPTHQRPQEAADSQARLLHAPPPQNQVQNDSQPRSFSPTALRRTLEGIHDQDTQGRFRMDSYSWSRRQGRSHANQPIPLPRRRPQSGELDGGMDAERQPSWVQRVGSRISEATRPAHDQVTRVDSVWAGLFSSRRKSARQPPQTTIQETAPDNAASGTENPPSRRPLRDRFRTWRRRWTNKYPYMCDETPTVPGVQSTSDHGIIEPDVRSLSDETHTENSPHESRDRLTRGSSVEAQDGSTTRRFREPDYTRPVSH